MEIFSVSIQDHKRSIWLSLVAIALMVPVILVYAGDEKQPIRLMHRPDTSVKPHPLDEVVLPVFTLDRKYRIESVLIQRLDDETVMNDSAEPEVFWHIISRDKPQETQVLRYGRWVGGLTPAVPGTSPKLLEAGYAYRLTIQTTEGEAVLEFTPTPNKAFDPKKS